MTYRRMIQLIDDHGADWWCETFGLCAGRRKVSGGAWHYNPNTVVDLDRFMRTGVVEPIRATTKAGAP